MSVPSEYEHLVALLSPRRQLVQGTATNTVRKVCVSETARVHARRASAILAPVFHDACSKGGNFSAPLIRQLLSMDRDLLARALRPLLPELTSLSRWLAGSAQEADDWVHEVVLRALESAATIEEPSRLRAWLFRVARNARVVVPHGVEHRPHAEDEVSLLVFEPAATLNTGNVVSERTVHQIERI